MWVDSVLSLFRQKLEECCVVMRRMALGAFSPDAVHHPTLPCVVLMHLMVLGAF